MTGPQDIRHEDEWRGGLEDISFLFDSDRKMSLDLKYPEEHGSRSSSTVLEVDTEPKIGFKARCRQIWVPLTAWATSLIFTIIYALFIYQILILSNPKVGNWIFDASLTNLLLSIFSQLYSMLLLFMLNGLLDAMRWSLASRVGKRGTSASSFFQLSPGTSWWSVLVLICRSKWRHTWGIFRLMLPFVGLGFGSVLKFQNTFEYHFVSQGPSIKVFAGAVPPDISVLKQIPASYMAGFFDTWSQQLNSYPRYSKPWKMNGCKDNCSAYFLPGGLEIARKVGPYLNSTILQGGVFNEFDSISIEDASGLAARFDSLDPGFKFDIDSECIAYVNPSVVSDGLQLCIRQMNQSVAAGWRACPSVVQYMGVCSKTDLWAKSPLETTTLMTVYRQNATTIYGREDLAIKQVKATSEAQIVPMLGEDTRKIWDRIFIPDRGADIIDNQSINVTINRLAWKYRTYKEFFPDNDSPVEQLRNFLSVPLQFTVTALQYANYTMQSDGVDLFPPELITVATGGKSIQKFVGQLWTSWVFICSGFAIVVLSGLAFWWILVQGHLVPNPSGAIELDFASQVVNTKSKHASSRDVGATAEGFRDMVTDLKHKARSKSASQFQALREWRVQIIGTEGLLDQGVDRKHSSTLRFVSTRPQHNSLGSIGSDGIP